MWLPLLLSLVSLVQPTTSFDTSFDQRAPLFRPTSLDDCVKLAANQLSQWKQVYGVCFALFLKGNKGQLSPGNSPAAGLDLSPGQWQVEPLPPNRGYLVETDARYQGLNDVNTGVTSVFTHKRSEGMQQETFSSPDLGSVVHNDDSDNDEAASASDDDKKRQYSRRAASHNKNWQSAFHSGLYRSRREHSFSINSALVSLADMLVAKNLERERARQRAFHQQLLSLGR